MFIICYDMAVKFFGVTIIKFDNTLYKELSTMIKGKDDHGLKNYVQKNNITVSSILDIVYMDVFDLNVSTRAPVEIKLIASKNVINHIDSICPKPDIVIIEEQFKKNDTTRLMMAQISSHYSYCNMNITSLLGNKTFVKNKLSYDTCKLSNKERLKWSLQNKVCHVEIVKPASKNAYSLDKSLKYQNFISKYRNTYDANKSHTKANLIYYCQMYNEPLLNDIKKVSVKLADISDCFMLTYVYILSNMDILLNNSSLNNSCELCLPEKLENFTLKKVRMKKEKITRPTLKDKSAKKSRVKSNYSKNARLNISIIKFR